MGTSPPPVLQAELYIRPMDEGGSKPHLIRCSDGEDYVVKFKGNPHGTRILGNEWIVARTGALVGAPVPEAVLVDVSEDFMAKAGLKASGQPPYEPGLQFGSAYKYNEDGPALQNPPTEHIKDFVNATQIPMVILLDTLMVNGDRKGNHIVYHAVEDGGFRFWMIDHGHCLGQNSGWATLQPTEGGLVAKVFQETIAGPDSFTEGLAEISKKVDEPAIQAIASEMPLDEWDIPDSDVDALASFIESRADELPLMIEEGKDQFPNWEDQTE